MTLLEVILRVILRVLSTPPPYTSRIKTKDYYHIILLGTAYGSQQHMLKWHGASEGVTVGSGCVGGGVVLPNVKSVDEVSVVLSEITTMC